MNQINNCGNFERTTIEPVPADACKIIMPASTKETYNSRKQKEQRYAGGHLVLSIQYQLVEKSIRYIQRLMDD